MNRRQLLLTTAKTALLGAFGTVIGRPPIDSRAELPIPEARGGSDPATPTSHNGMKNHFNRDDDNYWVKYPYRNLLKNGTIWCQAGGSRNEWNMQDMRRLDDQGYIKDFRNPENGCAGWKILFPCFGPPAESGRTTANYICRGKGRGWLQFEGASAHVPGTYAVTGKAWEWEFPFTAGNYQGAAFIELHMNSAPNLPNTYPNHVRDLTVLHVDDVNGYDAGELFNPRDVELASKYGQARFVGQTSQWRHAAKGRDFVPYDYITWVTYLKGGRFCGQATRDDTHGLRYSVPAPADGFSTNNHMEQCWVAFADGDTPPVIPGASPSALARGTTTKFTINGALHPAYAAGEWVFIGLGGANPWAPASLFTFPSSRTAKWRYGSGFKIISIDKTNPNNPIVELDVDTSADGDLAGAGFSNLTLELRQFLKIGNNDYVPLGRFDGTKGYYRNYGIVNTTACLFYDKLMNLLITYPGSGKEDADGHYGIPPPKALAQYCNRLGANGWFNIPYLACDGPDAIPNLANWPDFIPQLAASLRENLNPGLVAVFEPPNEQWNSQFPVFGYCMNKMRYYGSLSGQQHQWYGMALSALGQLVARAYGITDKTQVRSQTKYRIVMGSQYGFVYGFAERLGAESYYTNQPPAWSVSVGMEPAYEWTTDITVANYFNSMLYNTVPTKPPPSLNPPHNPPHDGDLWSKPDGKYYIWSPRLWGTGGWKELDLVYSYTELDSGGEWQMAQMYKADPVKNRYLLDDFISYALVAKPTPWDAKTTYTPSPDGNVPVVSYQGGTYLCKSQSQGVPPPNPTYWATARVGPSYGFLNSTKALANLPKFNPEGWPPLRCLAYEGGYSPDFYNYTGSVNLVDEFRIATMTSGLLRQAELENMQQCKDATFDFPAHLGLYGKSPWSVWWGSEIAGQYWGAVDPQSGATRPDIPPRYQAVLEWNGAELPKQSPKLQLAPPKVRAEQHAAPSWCQTLHHPNANLCGTVHESELPKRSLLPKVEDIRPRRRH